MTTHLVTLLFADGVAHTMRVATGGNLVEAAAADGLALLTDCKDGRCGTCTGHLCSGTLALDDYDRAVLPDEDRDAGTVLPCVAHIEGPCVVELPYDFSEACAEEPPSHAGRVVSVRKVAEGIARLEMEVMEPMVFQPGQYVRMRPPGREAWRSYSMANPSGSLPLEFYVRLVPGGLFSEWLVHDAKPGSELEISAPRGSFFLRSEARPRLFVAGGTGLAPFLSMLASIETDRTLRAQPTILLLGVRTPQHLFAGAELALWKERLPDLQVHQAVETGIAEGCHVGYATDLIANLGLGRHTRVYLCGPPPMVDSGRNACVAAGVARGEILCERFA